MTGTIPTQEQIDRVALELAPDVVRIRMEEDRDWTDDPALYFRVVLSDEASRRKPLGDVTMPIREILRSRLGLDELEPHSYFRFRALRELAYTNDAGWD